MSPQKKLIVKKITLLLGALILFFGAEASDLKIRGQIKGLTADDRKTVPVVLSNVNVSAVAEGAPSVIKTNLAGVYTLNLKRDKRYLITVQRDGYHSKSIWIDTHHLPVLDNGEHVELTDFDFLLLKKDAFPDDVSEREDMGQLYFDSKKRKFQLSVNSDFRQGKSGKDNSLRLLHKTITYLGEEEQKSIALEKSKSKNPNTLNNNAQDFMNEAERKIPRIGSELIESITTFDQNEEISKKSLEDQRTLIDSAKAELEYLRANAVTKEDSLNLARLEAQLQMLELDLDYAENIIGHQNDKIKMQNRLITLSVIFSVLLLCVLGVVFWFYRDKMKTNKILAEKNQMILDGINYANTIQRSFLKNKDEISKIVPEFSLMFRPRDIVSGDFYWLSEVNGKKIIAAIDCTGHGVPGAFISMIGNTLLNEIVNGKKILNPGKILEELHKGVMIALRQDADSKHSQDGMDMALISIDKNAGRLEFAGAKNHLYIVKDDKVEVIKANIESIGGRSLRAKDGFNKTFDTKEIDLDKESSYYMTSDGIIDQFGGPDDKKFNLKNFSELLKSCSKLSPDDQSDLLHKTFDEWKGNQHQLDDVLVMGLKFS